MIEENKLQPDDTEVEETPRAFFCPKCRRKVFDYVGDMLIIGTLRFVGSMRIIHGGGCDHRIDWRPTTSKKARQRSRP